MSEHTTTASTHDIGSPERADADARLAPVFERLAADDSIRVLSLDVFDTLLFRRVTDPADAFALIAQRLRRRRALAGGVDDALWANLREQAEARARRLVRERGQGVEVTLAEIHQSLPKSLFCRPVSAAELEEVECEVERELLVCDLDVLALVEAARDSGRSVIAVSDTYFSEAHLRRFMARGPLEAGLIDRVFVSSAHRTGKAEGLFSVVLEELGVRPEQLLHVGDNQHSDGAIPARLGVRTYLFERRPPALERMMAREALMAPAAAGPSGADGGLAALRAKALQREEGTRQPEGLRPFWAFGAGSLGPPLTAFADWVVEQARDAGCSRVFCFMREGQLLADLVNRAGGEDGPAAAPLWLSRQVSARASIVEGTHAELSDLFQRRKLPTLREYKATLGLTSEDLPQLAERLHWRLDDAGFGDEVIDAILSDPSLHARVVASAAQLRRRIVRYAEQLLPAGEDRLAVVDLGWGGTAQATLERLLREAGAPCRTLGLYLLTSDQVSPRLLDGMDARGFLASAGQPAGAMAALMRSPEVLEQVCMPDHGSQIDLTEDLRPVLADAGEPGLQAVQRAAVQQGVRAFQRQWLRYRAANPPGALPPLWEAGRERLLAMLTRVVVAPTGDEAALFTGWLHDENFGSQAAEEIASASGTRALRYLEPRELVAVPMTELYWPFGLAALHDDQLAAATALVSGGGVDWEAFSSELETGRFDVHADLGWGFEREPKASLAVRRNRRGLSLAKATVRGDFVKALQLRPARDACVLRLDWISLRCRRHGGLEPVTLEISSPKDFAALKFRGCHLIGDRLVMVPGTNPRIEVEVERRAGAPVYSLDFECAFAVLPLARSQARERWGRTKAALRRIGKESRLGAPLRLARRALRRLAG